MRNRILELLRTSGSEAVSGEEISRQLDISRTAVWKHIQTLKNEEFTSPQDIEKIYDAFFELRNIEKNYQIFEKNFAKFLCENWKYVT